VLQSAAGPLRFAQVGPRLFRGGQPSAEHLVQLRALGIDTLIDLRRESRDKREAEAGRARALGIRYLHFPFYGVFGADPRFLDGILRAMRDEANGRVYIHCKRGRDRTSLLVALYRVLVEGWDPAVAWQREVLDFGYQATFWYRRMGSSFRRMVADHLGKASPAPA
jgi:tyrosine-protein phosphatase SIW14